MSIDWVRFDRIIYCPYCGVVLPKGWQTKVRSIKADLSTLDFTEVDRFYNRCQACSAYVEINYVGNGVDRRLNKYQITAKYWGL